MAEVPAACSAWAARRTAAKLLEGQTPTTKFADVAGEDEAGRSRGNQGLLKDPSKYKVG